MFIVASPDQAKLIAKRLRKELKAALFVDITTTESLDLVAAMFGFPEGYQAMLRSIAGATPSRWDSESPIEEVGFRRRLHIHVLELIGVDAKVAAIIVDRVKPTEMPALRAEWVPPCHAVPGEAFLTKAKAELEAGNWVAASALAGSGALRCAPENQDPYRELIVEAGKHSAVVKVQIAQGMIYGQIFDKDHEGAVKLLLELSESGDRESQAMAFDLLGEISMGHHGGEPNPTQAARFYEKAAESGSMIGAINAGTIYLNQLDDPAKSEKCLRMGVALGCAQSKSFLGCSMFAGNIPGTKEQAAIMIEEAADEGDEDAIIVLPQIRRYLSRAS